MGDTPNKDTRVDVRPSTQDTWGGLSWKEVPQHIRGDATVHDRLLLRNVTRRTDVATDLSDFTLTRVPGKPFEFNLTRTQDIGKGFPTVVLENFNPAKDTLVTADGEFTLNEILQNGPNAPLAKATQLQEPGKGGNGNGR